MNKLFKAATISFAVVALVGCSDSATPVDGTKDASALTLEEVFNKSIERQEALESASATIEMEQTISMNMFGQEMNISTSTNMDMDIIVEPMSFYVEGGMTMAMEGEEEDFTMPLKMYLTESDGFYMQDTMTYEEPTWLKLPNDAYEEILEQTGAASDASEQLLQLKPYLSDFKFEQNDSSYLLTLNAQGEKFNDLILSEAKKALGDDLASEDIDLGNLQLEKANYIITIDKKTFDVTKMILDMDMIMEIEGSSSTIKTFTTIVYKDFNSIKEIKVPQDVIDSAVESDFY